MKIIGIIAEYNPFHLGHNYHLQYAKRDSLCEGVVCIMSGNFTQRGEPTLIDKWNRAQCAIENGIELVIELPIVYAMSTAENFAYGAVNILNKTKVVDSIYFGSEHDDINSLKLIANTLVNETDEFKSLIKKYMNCGLPFFKARENTLQAILKDKDIESIINNSNNILAIEYIKSIIKLQSNINPKCIKRQGALYNEITLESIFPSASAIRKSLQNETSLNQIKNSVPCKTYNMLKNLSDNNYNFVFPEMIFNNLRYKLLTEGFKLKNLSETKEGIENKILKEVITSTSLDELILNTKSKRYTYSYLSRLLSSFYIGLENYPTNEILKEEDYIRPLAFNSKGAEILKQIKNKSNIEIITKLPKRIENSKLLLDVLATKAYSILNPSISPMSDYYKSPIFLK